MENQVNNQEATNVAQNEGTTHVEIPTPDFTKSFHHNDEEPAAEAPVDNTDDTSIPGNLESQDDVIEGVPYGANHFMYHQQVGEDVISFTSDQPKLLQSEIDIQIKKGAEILDALKGDSDFDFLYGKSSVLTEKQEVLVDKLDSITEGMLLAAKILTKHSFETNINPNPIANEIVKGAFIDFNDAITRLNVAYAKFNIRRGHAVQQTQDLIELNKAIENIQ